MKFIIVKCFELHKIFFWPSNILGGKSVVGGWRWLGHTHHGFLGGSFVSCSSRVGDDPCVI